MNRERIPTRVSSFSGLYRWLKLNPDLLVADLNYFFGKIQSLAFEEEFKPDQMDDLTQPLLAGMHHKGGKVLRAFNDLMREDERASRYNLVPNAQTKRKAVSIQLVGRRPDG